MSGNNPYAANGGYGGYRQSNDSNPYAPTGTSNSVAGSRFADPYVAQQNNASSASVNSFGSQERRLRSNPYEQRNDIDGGGSHSSSRGGSGAGSTLRGYGGMPQPRYAEPTSSPRADPGYGREREREPQEYEQRQQTPQSFRDRERAYNEGQRTYSESRTSDRNEMRRQIPPPSTSTMPPKPSLPSLSEQTWTNGYTTQQNSYPPPENANRHYSPRRPPKSMEEIMRHIRSNWQDMEGDDCVPVKVAMRLMDDSSIGLMNKEGDFTHTHQDLQKCLKSVVNEHYADFNSAVGTYHKIQNAINESQIRVRQLKLGLMNVKDGMLSTRPELRGLAEQSGELDDMLATLNHVESFKTIPAKLEEKISEKKFLGAVDLLMESLKKITKSEFDGIGAIADLRNYFSNQESTLLDILIEELHDHLYLRSPYCRDRWRGKKANGEDRDPKDNMLSSGVNAWDRPFNHYLNNAELSTAMVEDPSKNPEADTFYYIHMILESLNKLGQLEEAVSRIEQRMPMELYKVVEKTNHDVDTKYPSHLRGQLNKANRKAISLQTNDGKTQVLSDFLWTLYSKFEAIAESHRVLHEVVGGIAVREKVTKPEKYTTGFKELWKLFQLEMRSILHDYLATDGENTTQRSGLISTATHDVFARPVRDKNRKMFRLSEMDQKSESMRAEQDELNEILKSSVPGLVSKSRARDGMDLISDRSGQDSTVAGHKLLIEPGVFNMTVLLTPSLTFLQRLKDIVPSTAHIPMSTLTSFLDNFLINVFQPQLEEAVTELCAQAIIDLEAFSEDTLWSKVSVRPIFKGTASLMSLIRAFSDMLSTIPQDQIFTQIIIDQIITYHDKCYGFYKALVSRVAAPTSNQTGSTLSTKAAAALAASGEVHDAAVQLLHHYRPPGENLPRSALIGKEVAALLSATRANPLSAYDIIFDPKSVHQLSLLYNSMQWLASSLTQIRQVDTGAHTGLSDPRRGSLRVRRWTLLSSLQSNVGGKRSSSYPGGAIPVFLPLTAETATAFDHTIESIRMLAQTSLLTLHMDIRCGIIHQLSRTLRGPEGAINPTTPRDNRDSSAAPPLDSGLYPYVLSSPPISASPPVLELNNDLIAFDANIASYLGNKQRSFILRGLSDLVDRFLVVAADSIGVMNENGAERIRIDAMVVQQNIRAILANTARKRASWDESGAKDGGGLGITTDTAWEEEEDGLLTSSSRYFDLFLTGPKSILAHVKECKSQKRDVGYSYDELRTLIELVYSAKLRGKDREEAVRARKGLQDALLGLGEGMWDT